MFAILYNLYLVCEYKNIYIQSTLGKSEYG